MLMAQRKKCVWVFSMATRDQSCEQLRIVAPFDYFPKDRYEFIQVPSLKSVAKILQVPDIILFQRILYPFKEAEKIIKFACHNGIPVVMDIDDLITDVPAKHSSHTGYTQIKDDIERMIRSADFVTVTNNRLKSYLSPYSSNIHVLPNLIDERIWLTGEERASRGKEKITIGYSGSLPHSYDLKIVFPAIRYILSKYTGKVCFKLIGCISEELKGVPGVDHIGEVQPYKNYARALKECDFDIVFAVLEDNPFNRSKSNIKFLEYSICGYPGVYSRVGPYIDSITHNETGLLVNNTTEEWIQAIELFINDPALRRRIGRNAYEHVKADYLLKNRAGEWRRVYDELIAPANIEKHIKFSLIPLISYGLYILYAGLRAIYFKLYNGVKRSIGKR
jgi:glycosyltransferase involved in cell wall biosynthesis